MSASMHVVGIMGADARWQEMLDLWLACDRANVRVPEEVQAFFGYEKPRESRRVEIVCGEYSDRDRGEHGLLVPVAGIPRAVRDLLFYVAH